jgi:hypothetical protein
VPVRHAVPQDVCPHFGSGSLDSHEFAFIRGLKTDPLNLAQEKGPPVEKPWMKHFGTLGKTGRMRAETDRIQRAIDDEFEQLEPEERG